MRHHPVGEPARTRCRIGADGARPRRFRHGAGLGVNEAGILHGFEHQLRPCLAGIGIGQRIVTGGSLDAAGDNGGFGQAQFIGMLAEEFFRRGFNAVNPGAEINPVEIQSENLILAVLPLHLQRQHGFLHLAVESAAGAQEEIFGQLLRERGTALHHTAALHVLKGGAHQPDGIDAPMRPEAAVFYGDEGVGDIVRQIFNPHDPALGQAAPRDQAVANIQNGDVLRWPADHQIADIRQPGQIVRNENAGQDHAPTAQHQQHIRPGAAAFARLRRQR